MLKNLTPHPVRVRFADGAELVIQATPPAARINVLPEDAGVISTPVGDIPLSRSVFTNIENLPEPTWVCPETGNLFDFPAEDTEQVIYITSTLVAQSAARADVVAPDTGATAIRNDSGQIVAVLGFQVFA